VSVKGRDPVVTQMELHNLHQRPHASASNTGNSSRSNSSAAAPNCTATPPEIRAAVTHEQWAKLQKDNDTLDKLVHKLAYQVEELDDKRKSSKLRADKYKEQLKQHVSMHQALLDKHDALKGQLRSLTTERDRLQAKTDEHKSLSRKSDEGVAAYKSKLDTVTAELKQLKAELPEVQRLLAQGGEATKRLKALESKESKRVEDLQRQLEASKANVRALNEKIHSSAGNENASLKSKNQQLQSELTSMRERLKAASTQASTSISQVQSCKEMLAKAEGVLRTCTELHQGKGDALASALDETTTNLAGFLKSLNS